MKLSEDAGFFAADQQARRTAGMQIRQIRFRFKFVFFDFQRLKQRFNVALEGKEIGFPIFCISAECKKLPVLRQFIRVFVRFQIYIGNFKQGGLPTRRE